MTNKAQHNESVMTREQTLFKHVDQKSGEKKWNLWFVLIVEFLGTTFLVSWILFPNVMQFGSGAEATWAYKGSGWESFNWGMAAFFDLAILQALWIGLGVFGIVLLCIWVSANFNPVVTIAEVKKGNDSVEHGLFKILFQFGAGFFAAWAMYLLSESLGTWDLTTTVDGVEQYAVNLSSIQPLVQNPMANGGEGSMQLMTAANESWFWFIAMAAEALLVFLLLGTIFWGRMSKLWRTATISILITLIMYVGMFSNTVALNPARLVGPAVINDIMRGANESSEAIVQSSLYMQWIWIFLIGEIVGLFLFLWIDSRTESVISSSSGNNTNSLYKSVIKAEAELMERTAAIIAQNEMIKNELEDLRKYGVSNAEKISQVVENGKDQLIEHDPAKTLAKIQLMEALRKGEEALKLLGDVNRLETGNFEDKTVTISLEEAIETAKAIGIPNYQVMSDEELLNFYNDYKKQQETISSVEKQLALAKAEQLYVEQKQIVNAAHQVAQTPSQPAQAANTTRREDRQENRDQRR